MKRGLLCICCVLLAVAAESCSHGSGGQSGTPISASHSPDSAPTATPVTVQRVQRTTLEVKVTAPGRTNVLEQQRVRAPFDCRVVSLTVTEGDHVRTHQRIGAVVSQKSEAALIGARAMVHDAHTPSERRDAQRALELARQNLVQQALHAPEGGIVVSHKAVEGDLLKQGDEIVSIAAQDSFVFIAQVNQMDVSRLQPHQSAEVQLAAIPQPMHGTVHALLPAASTNALTTPVRIDLVHASKLTTIGMFGTAQIVVGKHVNVVAVPQAAVLRDDVSGKSRVALVKNDKAQWETVQPGISQNGIVEINSPPFSAGEEVIVSGQVGLPDGAAVEPKFGPAPTPSTAARQSPGSQANGSANPQGATTEPSGAAQSTASQTNARTGSSAGAATRGPNVNGNTSGAGKANPSSKPGGPR